MVNKDELDWCYTPIVQSGGEYDLKSSAMSNNHKLHSGVILCSLGLRYKFYCSNIGRTFLIDPNKTQEKNYEFLLDLQQRVLEVVREGTKIKDIYAKALQHVKSKRPDLEKHFTKSIGFAMGIEFREAGLVLGAKNARELRSGMVLNLSLGFTDLENPKPADDKSKTYALLLVDTVRVTHDLPIVLTNECSKKLNEISYFFKDEGADDAGEAEAPAPRPKKSDPPSKSAILRSKFRSEDQVDESREQKRKEHQKQLFAQKQAEGLAKFSSADGTDGNEDRPVFRKFESYRSEAKLPREVRDLKVKRIVMGRCICGALTRLVFSRSSWTSETRPSFFPSMAWLCLSTSRH